MNWRDSRGDPVEVESGAPPPALKSSKANNVVAAIVHEVDGAKDVANSTTTTEEKEVQNLSEYLVEKVLSPDKVASPPLFKETIEVTKKSVTEVMAAGGEEDEAVSNQASSRVSSAANKSSKGASEAGGDEVSQQQQQQQQQQPEESKVGIWISLVRFTVTPLWRTLINRIQRFSEVTDSEITDFRE